MVSNQHLYHVTTSCICIYISGSSLQFSISRIASKISYLPSYILTVHLYHPVHLYHIMRLYYIVPTIFASGRGHMIDRLFIDLQHYKRTNNQLGLSYSVTGMHERFKWSVIGVLTLLHSRVIGPCTLYDGYIAAFPCICACVFR